MSAFSCGLRITCGLCGHTVCKNPDHSVHADDPHQAMAEHKRIHHPETRRAHAHE